MAEKLPMHSDCTSIGDPVPATKNKKGILEYNAKLDNHYLQGKEMHKCRTSGSGSLESKWLKRNEGLFFLSAFESCGRFITYPNNILIA
jgi:hypothetical protein